MLKFSHNGKCINNMVKPENEIIMKKESILDKCLSEALKSIKYLDLVIGKNKFEILATSTTLLIESIFDIYNNLLNYETSSLKSNDSFMRNKNNLRSEINVLLSSIIQISDKLLLNKEENIEHNRKHLSESLNKLPNLISNFIKDEKDRLSENKLLYKLSKSKNYGSETELNEISRSKSTNSRQNDDSKEINYSSSWSENLNKISMNGKQSVDSNHYIVRKLTKTITITSNNSNHNNIIEKRDTLIDQQNDRINSKICVENSLNLNIDKLALELSSIPSTNFTDVCNLLQTCCDNGAIFKHSIEEKSRIIKSISNEFYNNENVLDEKKDIHKINLANDDDTKLNDPYRKHKNNINQYMSILLNNQSSCPNIFLTSNIETFSSSSSSSLSILSHNSTEKSTKSSEFAASVDVPSINFDGFFTNQAPSPTSNNNIDLSKSLSDSTFFSPETALKNKRISISEKGELVENVNKQIKPESNMELCNMNCYLEYQNNEQMSTQIPRKPSILELRGGSVDALIILATSTETKDFIYQEAFLTTYRTMIAPKELIHKLLYRYNFFSLGDSDPVKDRASKSSFSLLIRVLDDLGHDLNDEIIKIFQDFVLQLILTDKLNLARLIRKKLINKIQKRNSILNKTYLTQQTIGYNPLNPLLLPFNSISQKRYTLLDFKSSELAEQMTLIDQNLFLKIELAEILLWSLCTKQSDVQSPNLIKFTEHFNNLSYWARTRLLEQNSRDREKYMEKFLKIMRWLRKMNNYNSYLALLSGLESAPIQRLDWPKNITETIKEFSILIDPKCGFKRLREAVANSKLPCIPHLGLILHDLTILHIANSDYLASGLCNFWKKWQQFNILEKLRVFRNSQYDFKQNVKITNFFNDFSEFINEDAQYALSEIIKPRRTL